VRDAVDASVAKPAPSRSVSHASTLPSRSESVTSSPLRSSHAYFPDEKYGSIGRPLRALISASSNSSSSSVWRLSCHTITGDKGSPVAPSQASTDSPWWSSPQPAISPGASASSSAIASTTESRISTGSCSTQPGCG
jgi:hypothetical protein